MSTIQKQPKWTEESFADALMGKYCFSEVSGYHKNDEKLIATEIRSDISNLFAKLQPPMPSDQMDTMIDAFFEHVPEGTDIDQQYGGSVLGIMDVMCNIHFLQALENVGAKFRAQMEQKYRQLKNNGGDFNEIGVMADILFAVEQYCLSEEQAMRALALCDKIAENWNDIPKDFREATTILRERGLEGLEEDLRQMQEDKELSADESFDEPTRQRMIDEAVKRLTRD